MRILAACCSPRPLNKRIGACYALTTALAGARGNKTCPRRRHRAARRRHAWHTGFEGVPGLRADPRLASVPIVMVTGHEDFSRDQPAHLRRVRRTLFPSRSTGRCSRRDGWSTSCAMLPRPSASNDLPYFDPLTALPNRQRCIETAKRSVREATQLRESVAIITWTSTASRE